MRSGNDAESADKIGGEQVGGSSGDDASLQAGLPQARAAFDGEAEARLVASACTGDREAYQRLYEKYCRLVTVLIYQKLQRSPDVEDLAQETFLRAWRGLPTLRNPHRFLPWLLRIARRLIADWRRSLVREPAASSQALNSIPRFEDPARRLAAEEDRHRLLAAMEKLPDRYRLVLTLRFLEGMTPHDIAQRLGEPSGTIRNRIFRGLALLGALVGWERREGRWPWR